jgi:hypothetical protein
MTDLLSQEIPEPFAKAIQALLKVGEFLDEVDRLLTR